MPRYNAVQCMGFMLENTSLQKFVNSRLKVPIEFLTHSDFTCILEGFRVIAKACNKDNWRELIPEIMATLKGSCVGQQRFMIPLAIEAIDRSIPQEDEFFIQSLFNVAKVTSIAKDTRLDEYFRNIFQDSPKSKVCKSVLKQRVQLVQAFAQRLLDPDGIPEPLLGAAIYMIGEHGHMTLGIISIQGQLQWLGQSSLIAPKEIHNRIIDALGKIAIRHPDFTKDVATRLQAYIEHPDIVVQSQACELLRLVNTGLLHELALQDAPKSLGTRDAISTPAGPGPQRRQENHNLHGSWTVYQSRDLDIVMDRGTRGSECRISLKITNVSNGRLSIKSWDMTACTGLEAKSHSDIKVSLEPTESVKHRLSLVSRFNIDAAPTYTLQYHHHKHGAAHAEFQLPVEFAPKALKH
ncbi:bifunctional Armadillo-like helical/Armadillo-type fold [Babesia duncani]|uniref:Bifunctional Armadillo-like helical/Armadillo-type fold n=1 Tax=Babesia duncani TaxID=323732 RepID=A0AAD9PM92_9APIC|nr:bifunctional Armadillo-like helical/Armadillo-type fold [Babesia duncani]